MSISRKLGFESLESRRTFAGNVFANLVGGELVLSGDSAANYVTVQQQMVGGVLKYVVRGQQFNGQFTASGDPVLSSQFDHRTTINGFVQPFRVNASGVRLAIDTQAGNDAVLIGGDTQGVAQMLIPRVTVRTGADTDYLRLRGVKINGAASEFSTLSTTSESADGGQAEAGNDKLVLVNTQVVNTDLRMGTGGGNDRIEITSSSGSTAQTDIFLFAGNGNDRLDVRASDLRRGRFTARMGEGTDRAFVSNSTFTRGLFEMGGGNRDHLQLSDVTFDGLAILRGGDGSGDLVDGGANVFRGGRSVSGFETDNL